LPEARERAPELGLEDDQCGDGAVLKEHLHDVADQVQPEEPRDEVDAHEREEPEEHLDRPCPRQEPEHVICARRDDQDLEQIPEPGEEERCHDATAMAWAVSSARRTGSTSCTRKRRAPRSTPTTQTAIVASRRSSTGSPPASSPTKRFLEGPRRTGNPRAAILSRCAIIATLCSVRLENPRPGSRTM